MQIVMTTGSYDAVKYTFCDFTEAVWLFDSYRKKENSINDCKSVVNLNSHSLNYDTDAKLYKTGRTTQLTTAK